MNDKTSIKSEGSSIFTTAAIASLLGTAWLAVCSLLLALLIGRNNSRTDKLILFWLCWDAFIHFGLEGSFVYLSLTGTVQSSDKWFAEPWKEYGKADKRWLVSDPTIVSLEMLTVFLVGPLCIVLIYAISAKRYYRHWLQLVVCTCELYGGWMTFGPELLIGNKNLVTGHWLYLWVYLVFFNGLWVIVPLLMMWQSWNAMSQVLPDGSSLSTKVERSSVTTRRTITETQSGGEKKKTIEVEKKVEQSPEEKTPTGRGRRKAKKLE